MTQKMRKNIFWIVTALLVCLSALTAGFASAQTDEKTLTELKPVLDEFGEAVGDALFVGSEDDVRTVYQNYEFGYVESKELNGFFYEKKYVGGKNVAADGTKNILSAKVSEYIATLTDETEEGEDTVADVFARLAARYGVDREYSLSYVLGKISDKYLALVETGYNPGLPTGPLSVWNGTVIKLDFYFGDSSVGFDDNRKAVTTIAYSLTQDEAFVLSNDFFRVYKDYSEAASLMDIVSDPVSVNDGSEDGYAQAFYYGYIFVSNARAYARLGYTVNGSSVEKIALTKDELTATTLTAYDIGTVYEGLTVDSVKTLFYNKYQAVSQSFNLGVPDSEGLSMWDDKLIKINFVGSDGTGNAWGRIKAMLLLGTDGNVYFVSNGVVNALADEGIGLGNPEKIGYPTSELTDGTLNGQAVSYQTFTSGVVICKANEYRFIKGVTFEEVKSTETKVDVFKLLGYLKPLRNSDFGAPIGKIIVSEDSKVYQNYEMGYVTANLISSSEIQNKRDWGGMNVTPSLERYFLEEKMEAWIRSRTDELFLDEEEDSQGKVVKTVKQVWDELAAKYEVDLEYDLDYVLDKIYTEYKYLCDNGYNAGIPTDTLSIWDGAVIKLDFYDGDGEYGFDASDRIHVTTLAYSFSTDRVFYISGDIFKFYKNAKAGSLGDPVSDPYEYVMDGKSGMLQNFEQGYIFCPTANPEEVIVKAGVILNEDGSFELIRLSKDEITKTDLIDAAVQYSILYRAYTLEQVKEAFWTKYNELRDSGYNPGIPDAEGIFYWDSIVIKQAYVGSDGTGDAWGRTNMMLMLNPDDGKVYMVNNEILNIVDEAAMGLGTAVRLGYPMSDAKEAVVDGKTYLYQDFSQGTIYSVEGQAQLTRFIKGKTFAQVQEAHNSAKSANNPSYYYVLAPWAIALICVGGAILCAGAVICLIIVKKKGKKASPAQAVESEPETQENKEKE